MNQQVSKMPPAVQEFRQQLSKMDSEVGNVLPNHISPEKFQRVVMTAVQTDPNLLNADRQSFFGAIMKCAQDGLLPDGRDAAFVIFNEKQNQDGKWRTIQKVQYMPMITGIHKKVRNSGELSFITTHVVRENDEFYIEFGDNEQIHHKPSMRGKRGSPVGAYAIAGLKDGTRIREYMDVEEIEKVRSVSKAGQNENAPWSKWWDEMAKKTVTRRLSKRLPMSSDVEAVFQRDDDLYDFEEQPKPSNDQVAARPTMASLEHQDSEPEPEINSETETVAAPEPEAQDAQESGGESPEPAGPTYWFIGVDGEEIPFEKPDDFVFHVVQTVEQAGQDPAVADGIKEGLRESNAAAIAYLPDYLKEQLDDALAPTGVQNAASREGENLNTAAEDRAEGETSATHNQLLARIMNAQTIEQLDHRVQMNSEAYESLDENERQGIDRAIMDRRWQLQHGQGNDG